jgi:hypothetical protein
MQWVVYGWTYTSLSCIYTYPMLCDSGGSDAAFTPTQPVFDDLADFDRESDEDDDGMECVVASDVPQSALASSEMPIPTRPDSITPSLPSAADTHTHTLTSPPMHDAIDAEFARFSKSGMLNCVHVHVYV